MSNAADWLRDAAARLTVASDTPRLDAELLLAHALEMDRGGMLLHLRDLAVPPAANALIARRLAHEPIAYITGIRDFWTISVAVAPGVLIPRPDSETLIEAAVDHFAGTAGPRNVLDLGTGSGALLLAALDQWPGAMGIGVDASDRAVAIARENAARLGMADRARVVSGDWADGIDGPFDLVLCNPPYICDDAMLSRQVIDHEPRDALFAGADGLVCYRALAPQIARLLHADGLAAIETGFDQGDSAAALFLAQGCAVTLRRDLAGRARCLMVTAPSSSA